jgi:hypothetical protein
MIKSNLNIQYSTKIEEILKSSSLSSSNHYYIIIESVFIVLYRYINPIQSKSMGRDLISPQGKLGLMNRIE